MSSADSPSHSIRIYPDYTTVYPIQRPSSLVLIPMLDAIHHMFTICIHMSRMICNMFIHIHRIFPDIHRAWTVTAPQGWNPTAARSPAV